MRRPSPDRGQGARRKAEASDTPREPGIFSARYRWMSIGIFAIVFLAAFEALAVTTVMPVAAAELEGQAFYALAFSGPLATGLLGMVIVGNWCDRRGTLVPLYATIVLFAVGLVLAGTASSMGMLIVGRLVHGLGGGAMVVPFYVIIARIYPESLRPRMFAGFAAAWSLPALVGPLAAGGLAEAFGWRSAFLGVLLLVAPAVAVIVRPLRRNADLLGRDREAPLAPWQFGRIAWALLAAVAVLGLTLTAELPEPLRWILAAVAFVVTLIALRPLLPAGAFRAARGLPTIVLQRLLLAAAFFGAEVYVPYLLVREYDWSPAAAGVALVAAGAAWALAAWAQGRWGIRLRGSVVILLGCSMLFVSAALIAAISTTHVGPALVIPLWVLAAFGGGFVYPRLSTLALENTRTEEQGFTSSALAITDAAGPAIALAITGLLAATALGLGAAFVVAAAMALGCVLLATRIRIPS